MSGITLSCIAAAALSAALVSLGFTFGGCIGPVAWLFGLLWESGKNAIQPSPLP